MCVYIYNLYNYVYIYVSSLSHSLTLLPLGIPARAVLGARWKQDTSIVYRKDVSFRICIQDYTRVRSCVAHRAVEYISISSSMHVGSQ